MIKSLVEMLSDTYVSSASVKAAASSIHGVGEADFARLRACCMTFEHLIRVFLRISCIKRIDQLTSTLVSTTFSQSSNSSSLDAGAYMLLR
jgi:hypothetical protein